MKSRSRQILAVMMALILVLPCLCPTYAEESQPSIVITVQSKEVQPGERFTLDVSITNNPGILYASLDLSYGAGLMLENATSGSAFSNMDMTQPTRFTSPCRFSWSGDSADGYSANGTILSLTFVADETFSSAAKLPVSVSVTEDFLDNNLNTVDVTTNSGTIDILNFTPGDINDDDSINVKDVVTLPCSIMAKSRLPSRPT